jgi:hypothetical protein
VKIRIGSNQASLQDATLSGRRPGDKSPGYFR